MCVCNWKCLYKLSLAGDTRRTRSACVCVCVSQYVCVCVCVCLSVYAHTAACMRSHVGNKNVGSCQWPMSVPAVPGVGALKLGVGALDRPAWIWHGPPARPTRSHTRHTHTHTHIPMGSKGPISDTCIYMHIQAHALCSHWVIANGLSTCRALSRPLASSVL